MLTLCILLISGMITYFLLDEETSNAISSDIFAKKEQGDATAEMGNKSKTETLTPMDSHYQEFGLADKPPVTNKRQAGEVIQRYKERLGLGNHDQLEIENSTRDEMNNEYYHLQQTYKGIPVFEAKTVLEIEQGHALSISGSWQTNIDVNVKPAYPVKQAVDMAFEKLAMTGVLNYELHNTQLIIYHSTVKPYLAWLVTIVYQDSNSDPELMIIDAQNLGIISRQPVRLN